MTRTGPETAQAADDVDRKRALILDHETAFARALAVRVIDRPAVSVWMILVPVLLVHFLQRRQTFKAGTAAFAEHVLMPRRRALEIAAGAPRDGPPLADPLRRAEAAQIDVLAEHYRRLLSAEGDDYRALVLAGYGSLSAYRRHLDRLEEAHDAIDAAVLANAAPGEAIRETVSRIRAAQRTLHREEAELLFA